MEYTFCIITVHSNPFEKFKNVFQALIIDTRKAGVIYDQLSIYVNLILIYSFARSANVARYIDHSGMTAH